MPGRTLSGESILYGGLDSPLGRVWLASSPAGICALSWTSQDENSFCEWLHRRFAREVQPNARTLRPYLQQISEYFQGRRTRFDMPLNLEAVSAFDLLVLRRTARIPFGKTVTYGEIAKGIGRPKASRAVGGALGRNPLPLIIPCHRVLTSQGKPGGFSGGGPAVKQWLLRFEKAV